jgi:hypothetical protein
MCKETEFMKAQVHRIDVDKWCQGVNNHYDPGEVYIIDWVYSNAKKFRDDWNNCLCKNCSNLRECGHMALSVCERFLEVEGE